MIFCARATRGLRRPSLDTRSGRSISPHPLKGDERAWREHYETRSFDSCGKGPSSEVKCRVKHDSGSERGSKPRQMADAEH